MAEGSKMESNQLTLLDLLLREHFTYSKPSGFIKVERVLGKSAATRVYADYPLQFMLPRKTIPAHIDAIVAYALTFGGGIVSGDVISCELTICVDATMVLKTQGCTNVYKAVNGKISYQLLKASVASGAVLAILPDSLVCFADSKYSQIQAFDVAPDANLVLVDWLTCGRISRGEVWNFESFTSINHIYIQGNTPLLLDSVCLEQSVGLSIADRMDDFQVIGLIVIYGSKLATVRKVIEMNVQDLTDKAFKNWKSMSSKKAPKPGHWPNQTLSTPLLFASCSSVGPQGEGLVVRVAAKEVRDVYQFLRDQLSGLEPLIGVLPYASR